MITNYYRPDNMEETLKLLSQPDTIPLGGGTWVNQAHDESFAVVDLQSLGLNQIQKVGNNLEIGACVTLQQLFESSDCHEVLKQAIRLEAGLNIRNSATVAGMLVTCNGRSAFATVMLALDSKIMMTNDQSTFTSTLGEYLPLHPRGLITTISLPLNVKSAFEVVGRTPSDKPIVSVALTRWSNGRTRLVLGGYGKNPILAMDGTESDGIETAVRNAFYESGDEWATGNYRIEVAVTLARRCLESIT